MRRCFPGLLLLLLALASTGVASATQTPQRLPLAIAINGLWFNPDQSGHGLVVEALDTSGGPSLLVYWFTYLDGRQVWLGGVGELLGDRAEVSLSQFSGGGFPPRFEPANVNSQYWGNLQLQFLAGNQLVASWQSALPGFGSGQLGMVQLTRVDSHAVGMSCLAGAYFNRDQNGHGMLVDISRQVSGADIVVVTWFAYNQDGSPLWLQGSGVLQDRHTQLDLMLPVGGDFPPRFEPEQVSAQPWGSLSLQFADDGGGVGLEWLSSTPGFANGSLQMERLTALSGHVCTRAGVAPRYPAIASSGGSGGAFPGFVDSSVTVAGLGSQDYFVFIPDSYQPDQSMPLMLVWHGAAGPGQAPMAARQARHLWSEVAADEGFMVVAQVATGSQGGWIPDRAQIIMDAILEQSIADYNIDLGRMFAWGFSAGGHLAHALVLARPEQFAGYGVNAGVLDGLAGAGAPSVALDQVPVSISVGDQDPLQPLAFLDRSRFLSAGWVLDQNLFYRQFNGGHSVSAVQLRQHWHYLRNFILDH